MSETDLSAEGTVTTDYTPAPAADPAVQTFTPVEYDLIVASTLDGWIGDPRGRMPWRQRADMQHFKRMTTGHAVIMGRKTLESIGSLLPHRLNVIVTHNPLRVDSWLDGDGKAIVEDRRNGAPRPLIVSSLGDLNRRLPEHLSEGQKAFIIGGDSLYQQALAELDVRRIWHTCLHTTIANASVETGWARFDLPDTARMATERGTFPADEHNDYAYSFRDYAVLPAGA